LQDQTGGRVFNIRARLIATDQGGMIGGEVVAEQGEAETALALKGTVAGPAVATEAAEEGEDVAAEAGLLVTGGFETGRCWSEQVTG
jgi:hypothetical protein